MLKVVFYYVLSLSLAGTAAALGILLVKTIFRRKLPASLQYYIWIAAMLLFLLPIRQFIPLTAIAFPYAFNAQPLQPDIVQPIDTAQNVLYHQANNALAPESGFEFPFYLLWAVGVLCYFIIKSVRYFTLKSRLIKNSFVCSDTMGKALTEAEERTGYQKKVQLRCCPLLHSPMAIGVVQPIIILPDADVKPEQLEMILIHELTHLKRHDLLFKLAAMVVTGIHWFNPICYLMLKDINDCCELNCDRLVVRQMEHEKKKRYCQLLIITAISNANMAEPSALFGPKTKLIKRRVYSIMNNSLCHYPIKAIMVILLLGISALAVACSPVVKVVSSDAKDSPSSAIDSSSIDSIDHTSKHIPEEDYDNDTITFAYDNFTLDIPEGTSYAYYNFPLDVPGASLLTEKDSFDLSTSNNSGKVFLMWPPVKSIIHTKNSQEYRCSFTLHSNNNQICAADDGTVKSIEKDSYGYNTIIISHKNGIQSLYMLCSNLKIKVDDTVKKGDVIAELLNSY